MPLITREFIWHRDSGFGHCHGESDFESAPKELRWVCFEASGENWPMPTLPAATCWNGQINRCSLAYWEGFVWEVFSHSMCYCMMSLPVSSFTKKRGGWVKTPFLPAWLSSAPQCPICCLHCQGGAGEGREIVQASAQAGRPWAGRRCSHKGRWISLPLAKKGGGKTWGPSATSGYNGFCSQM